MDATAADIADGTLDKNKIIPTTADRNTIAIYSVGAASGTRNPAAAGPNALISGSVSGFNAERNVIEIKIPFKRTLTGLNVTHLLVQAIRDSDLPVTPTTEQLRASASDRNKIVHDLIIPVTPVIDVSSVTTAGSRARANVYKLNYGGSAWYDLRVLFDSGSLRIRILLTAERSTTNISKIQGRAIAFRAIRGIGG